MTMLSQSYMSKAVKPQVKGVIVLWGLVKNKKLLKLTQVI